MVPYLGAKGLMRWKKVGSAVEFSEGSERRQPILEREVRQADSVEADILSTKAEDRTAR